MLYGHMSGMIIMDRYYLIQMEGRRQLRGKSKKLRKGTCSKDRHTIFHKGVWMHGMDTDEAGSVQKVKEKLDKLSQIEHRPRILQTGT